MRAAGIDLRRMNSFIKRTEDVGGVVSKLTLATPHWITLFKGDHDYRYLVEGCAYGFSWDSLDPPEWYEVPNYVPNEHIPKVTERIQEELAGGRIVKAEKSMVCGLAAIGVVDKQRSGFVKYRVVHDYSRPHGSSVNDQMRVDKRRFATFKQARDSLMPRAHFCKIDLANAYRSVPMAEEWWRRHAFQWQGQVYMDLRMPFGSRGAPAAFDRITQALVRLFKSWGFPSFVGYLDDFWLMVAD